MKKPTLAGKKNNFSIHLFRHRKRLFHLSTENGRFYSVRDGHQSDYSRADVLFTFIKGIFHNWTKEKIFPSLWNMKQNKVKYKMHDFIYEASMKNINNHHPRARFININSSSLVFTLWKEGETSSTTSLLLIRPSKQLVVSGYFRIH